MSKQQSIPDLLGRRDPVGGALPEMDGKYLMLAGGFTPTPEVAADVRSHVLAVTNALSPWRAAYDYLNVVDSPRTAESLLPRAAYQRLRQIKAEYDPDGLIVSAHPVEPVRT